MRLAYLDQWWQGIYNMGSKQRLWTGQTQPILMAQEAHHKLKSLSTDSMKARQREKMGSCWGFE